ncbi:hypothetical protein EXIGLDRAFT_766459 [Exidia glandulosa HHB12029]|uniref:F-box domain-containing protein n=1 Tax=Exidia glandulosa HHB12029 TaxID=1314781 RepID=A0A165JQM2_EXIGL|nr:hypothetical protein EXIGLDRAFT_766459 [Exidia glandulosa HHB12029]
MSSSQVTLPYDLLFNIVDNADPPTLRHLCLVSRELHGYAVHELYRHLRLDDAVRMIRCLETLRDSTSLGAHVRSLHYKAPFLNPALGTGPIPPLLAPALRSMIGLRHLFLTSLMSVLEQNFKDTGTSFTSGVFDAIAGLAHLDDIEVGWLQSLTPLLPRLNPLKRLVFDAGNGINNYTHNPGLEHILRASADTLDELHLTGFGIISWLKKEPTLVFTRATKLTLQFCDPLGMELVRAFPRVQRVLFFPSPIQPLSLFTEPTSFPELQILELGVNEPEDFEGLTGGVGRAVATVSIFDASKFTPSPELLDFLSLFNKDALRHLQLPSMGKDDQPATTVRTVLGLFPNLEFICAKLPGAADVRSHPVLLVILLSHLPDFLFGKASFAISAIFGHLQAPKLRGVSLRFNEDIPKLAQMLAPRLNDMRRGLSSLTFFELRSTSWLNNETMGQFRLVKGENGAERWSLQEGNRLPPPDEWSFRY